MCEICGEVEVYGYWHDEKQETTAACRRCLRQLSIAEARRKQSLRLEGLAPLTDDEVARLLFTRYLMAEGVITEECESYEAVEL